MIIIVGNRSGEIIQSTLVKFTPEIKESHGKVLQTIKSIGLNWLPFYNNDKEDDEGAADVQTK